MKYKHKREIEEKFFGYELNATSLEKYKKHRFFNIDRVAIILFLFSRMSRNRKSLEDLIPNSILVYSSYYNELMVNCQVPTLIINIGFGSDSLNFYYNCPHTIKIIHNLG